MLYNGGTIALLIQYRLSPNEKRVVDALLSEIARRQAAKAAFRQTNGDYTRISSKIKRWCIFLLVW